MTQVKLSVNVMGKIHMVDFVIPEDLFLDPEFSLEKFISANLKDARIALMDGIEGDFQKENHKILYGDGSTPPPTGIINM